MTRTIYFVAASLDGYVADARGGLEWLTQFDGAEGVREHYEAFLAGVGALAMGAETYAFLLAQGGPWPYPSLPTCVFTHRAFATPEGADVRFVSGDVEGAFDAIARAAGERAIWLVGGGKLAAQFAAHGKIDELHLGLAPLVLGGGVPLLPAALGPMTLLGITTLGRGFVELRYSVR